MTKIEKKPFEDACLINKNKSLLNCKIDANYYDKNLYYFIENLSKNDFSKALSIAIENKIDISAINVNSEKGLLQYYLNLDGLTFIKKFKDLLPSIYKPSLDGSFPIKEIFRYSIKPETITIMKLLKSSGIDLNCRDINNFSTFDYFLSQFQTLINGTKKETLIDFFNFIDDNLILNNKNNPSIFMLKNFHILFTQDIFGIDLLFKMKNLDPTQSDNSKNNLLHVIMGSGNYLLIKYFKNNHKNLFNKLITEKNNNNLLPIDCFYHYEKDEIKKEYPYPNTKEKRKNDLELLKTEFLQDTEHAILNKNLLHVEKSTLTYKI